jgi:hypothetical protein
MWDGIACAGGGGGGIACGGSCVWWWALRVVVALHVGVVVVVGWLLWGCIPCGVDGPTTENEQSCSFSGWCWQEKGPTLKNEQSCSFLRGVGGDGGQRNIQPPKMSGRARFRGGAGKRKTQPSKTSSCACFWEVWVVVLARGRFNPRKRAVTLVFGGCGWWWWPKKSHNSKNERNHLFMGVMGGGGCQGGVKPPKIKPWRSNLGVAVASERLYLPKTSHRVRFRGAVSAGGRL